MNHALLTSEFERNFSERGDLGASVSIWEDGRETLSLAAGFQNKEKTIPWTAVTPVLFWSVTKGLAAACLHQACERRAIPLAAPVAEFWPEFGAAGKERITIAEMLSHRAALPSLVTPASVLDYDAVVRGLEQEAPHWPLGEGHGYHPRTYGFLVDELVRRITGKTLREYWCANFADPLGLDLWIGVPPERVDDVAPVFPARTTPPKGDRFYIAFLTAGSLTARSFASPKGLHSAAAMNAPDARVSSFPGFGGIGTASSLAKFYAMLACGGELEGRRYFQPETIALMSTPLVQGQDRVLLTETAFAAGYMQDPVDAEGRKIRHVFGPSTSAFGQPGAGGSNAFADPENRRSFAYVMNQMDPGVLPTAKSLALVEAMYSAS